MRSLLLLLVLTAAACGPVHRARLLCDDAPKAIRHVATECRALTVATEARRLAPGAHKAAFHESVHLAARAVLAADSLHWRAHADTLRTRIGLLRARDTAVPVNTAPTPPPSR